MQELIRNVTISGLLHDIGKILHRGSNVDGRAHSISGYEFIKQFTDERNILDGIRFHHYKELISAGLDPDNPAYAVYLADNIASGIDRREIEGEDAKGFDKNRPLESVYNLLNNSEKEAVYKVSPIESEVKYTTDLSNYNAGPDYTNIVLGLKEGLKGIEFNGEYVNSLLELSEAYLSYIPSSTYRGEVADISLFDHAKLTAALAACIVLYLQSNDRSNYQQELFANSSAFYNEKAFCMFSCDISGIQPFIYTISSKGALKGLRARSFYLELMLENLADEILQDCSLYRTNLIYTGGGHAYIIIPNTLEARSSAQNAVENLNRQLVKIFEARLFIGHAMQDCSANEIMNKTSDHEAYSNIFRSLAAQISERKLRRYNAAQLRILNGTEVDKSGRECRVCGISSNLVQTEEDEYMCANCTAFEDISIHLIKPDALFVVSRQESASPALPLFAGNGEKLYCYAAQEDKVRHILGQDPEQIVRVYSKNEFRTGLSLATKLWLGDYSALNPEGDLKTFAQLAESSHGIKRIGVLRADVDNMGTAFVKGFIREALPEDKYRYLTLSRTATLSRSLSIFFKYYLNNLLANGPTSPLAPPGARNIVVVYSGGDDLFLVGAWNEVLAAALDIRSAFARYTGQTLTMSAGFAIFEPGYPIARMAAETETLEGIAKQNETEVGAKNSISLFGMELDEGKLKARHTYDWDTFENQVLGEKFNLIDELFKLNDYGNSFLYSIMELMSQAEESGMNIARLAYLLARREPAQNAPKEIKQAYQHFSQKVYEWAFEDKDDDRRQLVTALIIYTYINRESKEGA